MQIQFFIQVMNYLKQISESGVILEKYSALRDALKKGAAEPGPDVDEEVYNAREQLRLILLDNDPAELGYSAYRVIERIDRQKVFGKEAADFLQEIPAHNIEYRKLSIELGKKVKALSQLLKTIQGFYEVFDQFFLAEILGPGEGDYSHPGLYIYFEKQVTVKSFKDLERFTRIWDDIIGSFSNLTGGDHHEIDYCNLMDETIILGINTDEPTMVAMIKGTSGIVNLVNPVVKIRKIKEELTQLNLQNDYQDVLDEEVELLIDREASLIANELYETYYSKENGENDIVRMDLIRALKQVFSFIQKGGKLEYIHEPEALEKEELNKLLIDAFRRIKDLDVGQKSGDQDNDEIKSVLVNNYLDTEN